MTNLTPERRAELRRDCIETEQTRKTLADWATLPWADELLALLDTADERDKLASAVERVRALHRRDHYLGEPGDADCPHDADYQGPRHFENQDGMWLCEDTPSDGAICAECMTEEWEHADYPCATIRALDGTDD